MKTTGRPLRVLFGLCLTAMAVPPGQAAGDPGGPPGHTQVVFAASPEFPRMTEGSILQLQGGDLMFAVTRFVGNGSDFAEASIISKRSRDGGHTWGPPRVLQKSTGKMNVMSVTLRRLQPPQHATILMFYLQKNDFDDLRVMVRRSVDEGVTFGDAAAVTNEPGYHVMNNDRVTQLSSGRLLAPIASTSDVRKVNHFVSRCWISDDGGLTWRPGAGQVDQPRRGAMEPEVVELRDGRVMMLVRNQLGTIGVSYSRDGGDTWTEPGHLPNLRAPEAPCTVRRIPSTGDLLLVWNDTYVAGEDHGGRRTPLTAAISSDEGATWRRVGNLESNPDRTYSYPSLIFSGERALMSYWEREGERFSARFRSVPIDWFYQD